MACASAGFGFPVYASGVERADAAQCDAARSDRRASARLAAAQVRFLFGLPFAVDVSRGPYGRKRRLSAPRLTAANLAWTVFGAASQVIATSLMLAAMRTKSFVVAVAYTKTEAAQIAALRPYRWFHRQSAERRR